MVERRLSFPAFSENMQRKASHTTKVTHISIFSNFPFQRWLPLLSIQRALAAESLGVERKTGGRRNLVFHKGCWFFFLYCWDLKCI